MKADILVSIVVPVYNNEKDLEACLDSLINQTYKNIEIILVNDGSSDSSYELMKKYEKKYSNIVTLTGKNQGASKARHKGIKKATGSYMMFVDADDWIDKNTVWELVKILNKKSYDNIRFFGVLEPSGVIKNQYQFSGQTEKALTKEEVYQLLITSKTLHNLCFGIYKSSLLKNIESFENNISFAEDYWANLDILTKAQSVLMINKTFYHYRENQNSTTKQIVKEKIIKNTKEAIFVYSKLFNYLKIWKVDTLENRREVAFTILDNTRWSIFNLLKDNNIKKEEWTQLLKDTFDQEVFQYIRKNISFKELKKVIKKKSIKYKLKNYYNIKMIYQRKYHRLWINKYLFLIKY